MSDKEDKNTSSKLNERKKKRQEWWAKQRQHAKSVGKEEDTIKKKIRRSKAPNESQDLETKETAAADSKHILFIGNLSYDCSENDIRDHFSFSTGLQGVRILTKKATGKSKGCAFIEFEDRISQMKALKLHHSMLCGRKINVEVTCGGGGKGEHRMNKLKSKIDKMKEKRRKAKVKKKSVY